MTDSQLELIMCSKAIIFLLLSAFLTSSCKWVGESKVEPQKVVIQSQVENCFVDFNTTLEKLLKSTLLDEEINTFFNCTEKSIDDFMKKTAERDTDLGYSRDEVKALLKTFLLKNKSELDSERYSRLFLVVKRMLIGGSSEFLSRQDWLKIKNLLPDLIALLINIKPYTQYYYFYNKSTYQNANHSFKLLNTGHDQLAERLSHFLELIKNHGSALSAVEIKYLKDELLNNENLKSIDPLLTTIIEIFYSFPASRHQDNWSDIFRLAEKGLRVMTYVKKMLLQNDSVLRPEGGVAIAALIRSIIDAFAYTNIVNSNLNLDQEHVVNFVVSLNESQLFFKDIDDPEIIRDFVNNIGQRLFVQETVKRGQESSKSWHISTLKINQFKFIHNRWMESIVQSLKDTSYWDLKDQYENQRFLDVDYDASAFNEGIEIYNDIIKASPLNLAFPGLESKVNFQVARQLSQQNDVLSNFYKTMLANVVILVFDTFGGQSRILKNVDKHVAQNTAENFYDSIRGVAISEGIASPLSCDSGGRTFLEANLFTYSANGNDKIEVHEGLEWLALVSSSSSVSVKLFNDIALDPACVLPSTSLFQNKPYLKKSCVKSFILENYRKYLNHMPNLLYFIESQNKLDEFYQNLFEVTRTCANSDLPVSYDEIVYSISLLGYIEALFERYDTEHITYRIFTRPRNDLLEIDELNLAYEERFKSILKRMAKLQTGKDLNDYLTKVLFKKLLIFKKMPTPPKGYFEGTKWVLSTHGVSVRPLTRIDIYKMFNSILTLNEVPEVSVRYCQNLTKAWEEYLLSNEQIFNVEVPMRSCVAPEGPQSVER